MLKKIIIFSIICYAIINLLDSNCIGEYINVEKNSEDSIKSDTQLYTDTYQYIMLNDKLIENELTNAYKELLTQKYEDFQLIPEGTKINKVISDEGNVLIDFSSEILNYGGITWEEAIIEQLLGVAFSFDKINSITFTIDNNTKNFVEGSVIYRYTRINWNERNCFYNEGNSED